MLSFLKHIIISLAFISVAGLTISCDREEIGQQPAAPEASGMVSLNFRMGRMAVSSSENADAHPEEDPIDDENKIYPGEWLHVYVHDAVTNERLLHFNQNQSVPALSMFITETPDGDYDVKINTSSLERGRKYRLSVMANCLDPDGELYPVASSFQNTSEWPDFLQKPLFMPHSGFKEFMIPEDAPDGYIHDIGTLWLLRASARIDVKIDPGYMAQTWEIIDVKIPDAGYSLYNTAYASVDPDNIAGVTGTEKLSMDSMFRPRTEYRMDNPKGKDIAMRDVNADKMYWRIYLPEQHNPYSYRASVSDEVSESRELYVLLQLKHKVTGQTVDAKLYIRDFINDPDTPINLVRNHIYRYTVKSVKPLFDVDFEVLEPKKKEINVPSFD